MSRHDIQHDLSSTFMGFVSPEWLESHLGEADLRIVQLDGEKYYYNFHIPGASQIGYGKLVTKRREVPGMLADAEDLAATFGQLGIGNTTPVVAYDLTGGLDAARLLWSLAVGGHVGFRAVLDGGLNVWYSDNRPMEAAVPEVERRLFQWHEERRWNITHEEVMAIALGDRDAVLVDTRSEKEYLGQTQRHPRGHIPGAIHYDWTDSLMGPRDVRLKDRALIEKNLVDLGLADQQREVVVYCETAHRAAHTWLLLHDLGYTHVRLYDGSMAEWRVLELPVTI
ncbi:MAG: sulfurtransferase [Magnetococcales bacterium]|nr:sulfurtransferase [Magnetococcales bacterium]